MKGPFFKKNSSLKLLLAGCVLIATLVIGYAVYSYYYYNYSGFTGGRGTVPMCGLDGKTYTTDQVAEENIEIACGGPCPCRYD